MPKIKDTPTAEAEQTHPADPQQTGSGSAQAPGGADAPRRSTSEMTHGQEGYPGPRDAGESDKNGTPPEAGDTDPDSTASADETGQSGVNDRPGKDTAHAWNG